MPKTTRSKARTTRLTIDLKASHDDWISWCQSQGLTPSEGVRQAILKLMAAGADTREKTAVTIPAVAAPADDGWRESRVQIRLTDTEHATFADAAKLDGMSLSRWFIGLARRRRWGEVQLGVHEVEALSRSSQALLALGRNINQIARHMALRPDSDPLTLDQTRQIGRSISHHTEMVSTLLAANSSRWWMR